MKSRIQLQDSVYNEQKRLLAEQVTRSDGTQRPGTAKTVFTPSAPKSEIRIRLRPKKTAETS